MVESIHGSKKRPMLSKQERELIGRFRSKRDFYNYMRDCCKYETSANHIYI